MKNINSEFEKLPNDLQIMKDQIKHKIMKKIYSLFDFSYHKFSFDFLYNSINENVQEIKNKISKFFIEDKFLTISFSIYDQKNEQPNIKNIIICGEKKCLILESLYENIVYDFLNEKKCSYININDEHLIDSVITEINMFEEEYSHIIKNSEFIKMTIRPIICYLIRRYFYPTHYFKDPSFFYFDDEKITNEQLFKNKIESFFHLNENGLCSINVLIRELFENIKMHKLDEDKNEIEEFNEKDFIVLRVISTKAISLNMLVMHIDSLHVFMMKQYHIENEECFHLLNHEVEFCKYHQHRCLTKCYGFIKEKNQVKSIIYEYMSNDSLEKNKENINEINAITIVNRLFQIISYLQSHNLIYQDIKKSNILLNHDFIPFLNDFETIREVGNDITLDVYTKESSSPEQKNENGNISLPTDIYSFGKIVDHLKNHLKSDVANYFNDLSQICINEDQNKRAKLDQIQNHIDNILNNFYYKDKFIIHEIRKSNNHYEIINMFLENLIYQLFFKNDENLEFMVHHIMYYVLYNLSKYKNISKVLNNIAYFYLYGSSVKIDNYLYKIYFKLGAKQKHLYEKLGKFYLTGNIIKQKIEKAAKYYEMSLLNNNSTGIMMSSIMNILGLGMKQDFTKGVKLLETLNQDVDQNIFYFLGLVYLMGICVDVDYEKAKKYFEISDNQGNSNASSNLGSMYYLGKGVKRNDQIAFKYFTKSANQNNIFAIYNLACFYENGFGTPKDINRAIHLYQKAAKMNILCANLKLGMIYNEGTGVEKNFIKAKEYFEIAANDNPEACLQLGHMYLNGNGVKQDYLKAIYFYKKSAMQNYSEGLYELGKIYYEGLGIQKNTKMAFEYFNLSSKGNNPNAFFYKALQYENGKGVILDIANAIDLYKKCTEIEKFSVRIKCDYQKFLNNFNCDVDDDNGIAFYFQSIKKLFLLFKDFKVPDIFVKNDYVFNEEIIKYNNFRYHAFNNLGLCYITEFQDFDEAFKYIKESGGCVEFPIGQNNLGLIYQYIKNNKIEAIYYYTKASNNNFALAEYNLGKLYEDDDFEKSIEHYIKASKYAEEKITFNKTFLEFDERQKISQAFIICLTNLKLVSYYLSEKQKDQRCIEKAKKYLSKALINPILILMNQIENSSCFFEFERDENDIMNIKDFILNCPLFGLSSSSNETKWKIKKFENEKIIINNKLINNKMNEKEIENTKEKMYAEEKLLKLIENDDFLNFNFGFLEKNKNKIEIYKNSKYNEVSAFFFELINIIIQDENEIKNEIDKIIVEMDKIIHTPPYLILFGRMKVDKNICSTVQTLEPFKINNFLVLILIFHYVIIQINLSFFIIKSFFK